MSKQKRRKPKTPSFSSSSSSSSSEREKYNPEETEYNSEDIRAWEEEEGQRREEEIEREQQREEDADDLLRSLENPSSSRYKSPVRRNSPPKKLASNSKSSSTEKEITPRTSPRPKTPPRAKTPPRPKTPPRAKTPPRPKTPPRAKTPPASSAPVPQAPAPATAPEEESEGINIELERTYPAPKKLFKNDEANELYNNMIQKYGVYQIQDITKFLKVIFASKDPFESKINSISSNLISFSATKYEEFLQELGKELILDNAQRNQNVIKLCKIVDHQNNIFINTRNIRIFDAYLTNLKLFESEKENLLLEIQNMRDKAKKSYVKSEMISSTFYKQKLLDFEPQNVEDVVKIQNQLIALEDKVFKQMEEKKEYMDPAVYSIRLESILQIQKDTFELEQKLAQLSGLERKYEMLRKDFEQIKNHALQSSV